MYSHSLNTPRTHNPILYPHITITLVMIETIALVLTGLSITASLVYYTRVLENQNKARQRELILQRSQGYNLEYSEALNEVAAQLDWTNTKRMGNQVRKMDQPKSKRQIHLHNESIHSRWFITERRCRKLKTVV